MTGEQYLIGTVAMGLGVFSLTAALKNVEWFFQLAKVQWLEAAVGRARTRWICGLLGCGLILLGLCIVAGWLPRKGPMRGTSFRSVFDYAGVAVVC